MIPFNPETAVLLVLSSKKIEFTTKILDRIKEVAPRRLYIVHNTSTDAEGHDEFGVLLANTETIDWPCSVSTLCKPFSSRDRMIREAISWFFEAEPRGIVLENITMPRVEFFGFCSELLDKYENDDRVSHISGVNKRQNLTKDRKENYYFSAIGNTQVWAGWRRSVKDISMKGYAKFKKADFLGKIPSYAPFKSIWYEKFAGNVDDENLNIWATEFAYSNLIKGRFSIMPCVNMTDWMAMRDSHDRYEEHEIVNMKHPEFVLCDYQMDVKLQEAEYSVPVVTKNVPDGYNFVSKKLLAYSDKIKDDLRIPRIIHQIYEDTAGPPSHLLELSQSWKEKNPDWEYRFWGKAEMEEFLETHFPEFIPIYKNYPFNVQRWDAIRYLILYKIGGLYVDFDYECLEPMDVLLAGSTCCMGMEPTINADVHNMKRIVGNAMMASIPGHKYFESLIEDMIENRDIVFSNYGPEQIMQTTGPFFTTRIYEKLHKKSSVTLLPAGLVAPLTMNEVRMALAGQNTPRIAEKLEHAYAIHYFLGSWCTPDVFQPLVKWLK